MVSNLRRCGNCANWSHECEVKEDEIHLECENNALDSLDVVYHVASASNNGEFELFSEALEMATSLSEFWTITDAYGEVIQRG